MRIHEPEIHVTHSYLFLSATGFSLSPVCAQETSLRRLSLEDAVRMAMKTNPDLLTARLEVKRSDARVLEAWGNAMPAVDITGQYVHMIDSRCHSFPTTSSTVS